MVTARSDSTLHAQKVRERLRLADRDQYARLGVADNAGKPPQMVLQL